MRFPNLIVDCLSAGRPVRFRARGSSMHPTIRSGDSLLVAPVEPDRVRTGDIILYAATPSRLLAHRVIEIVRHACPGPEGADAAGTEAAFLMKGDGCPHPDPPVASDRVLGKVAAVERNGRRINPYRPLAGNYARAYRFLRGLIKSIAVTRSV
jgi:signal peptidase